MPQEAAEGIEESSMAGKQGEPGSSFTCGQQHRADKGLLALPAASSSLHKSRPFSESSCWLSCLVRPQSRKPQREVDLLQFSTGSQASLGSQQASKRPGPPAGPVLDQGCQKAHKRKIWGVFN